jgi:homogentisate 1,2-dioxygenase
LFVHEGTGELATHLGNLPFGPGDYLYSPRGTIQQLRLEAGPARLLVIEAAGQIDTPRRYRNEHGQLLEHAPYWEHAPRETDELAVMVDTFRPLRLARACAALDDLAYLRSWDDKHAD